MIEGKTIIQTGTVLRGDLAGLSVGTFTSIREECVIRPIFMKQQGRLKYTKMTIGDNVYIDKNCIICALKIGNNVQVGKNCVIGHRAQIHDCAKILDNSILPPDAIVPPYTVYGGRPA